MGTRLRDRLAGPASGSAGVWRRLRGSALGWLPAGRRAGAAGRAGPAGWRAGPSRWRTRLTGIRAGFGRWFGPGLRAVRRTRAWQETRRVLQGGLRRWRGSLQLRIVTITLVLSGLLVAGFGFVVAERITQGLVDAKLQSALDRVEYARQETERELSSLAGAGDPDLTDTLDTLISTLADVPGQPGEFEVVLSPSSRELGIDPRSGPPANDAATKSVPTRLRDLVRDQAVIGHQFTRADPDGAGLRPFLVVGTVVQLGWGGFELYLLFPLDAEVEAAALVRTTVLVTGVTLVLLLALIAWIVTRMVVNPVRIAARTAQRLSAGLLHERMAVRGQDDLAKLAASFNQMASNLQQQIVQLEELSRLQRRFTSDVSHELRTPLTTVRMAADMLHTAREEFTPDVARSAELLYAELDRFESLLTDLLEISRFDAGFAQLESDAVDITPIVRRAVDTLRPLAQRQRVPVEVVAPAEPVIAEADARRVERILRNLIGNAIEHGEARGVTVTLACDARAVAITVRDRGVGLKPGEESLVFNRFWRADPSRARHTGGTGLGLSISLEDARLHGGWLEAWGAPGRGSQFRLTLPVRAGGRVDASPLRLVPENADRPIRESPASESSVGVAEVGGES